MNGVKRAERFVRGVLKKPHLYPITIKQACDRYLADKKRKDVYLDQSAANFVVSVVESMPHTKGELQGKPMLLEDWQCFFYANVFGWKWTESNYRRFRYAFLFVPRKNGKTAMAIPAGLIMLGPDQEKGAEVYFGAVGEQHAKRLLFKPARYICDKYEEFRDRYNIEVNATTIVRTDNDSVLTTVIKNPNDGDSPHFAIIDEYHEHKDSEQYDTFDTGMGARNQPLLMVITTAGTNLNSPCKSEYDECLKVLGGTINADDKFAMVYAPDKDDDWREVKTLRKVNPNMGVSISERYLLSQLEKAKQSAEKQSAYKTKHVNTWVGSRHTWMNMYAWEKQGANLEISEFSDFPCMVAVDLASKKDIAAISIVFYRQGEYYSFAKFYAPEAAVDSNRLYSSWAESGYITLTDGAATDFEFIEQDIRQICSDYDVLGIGFDDWQANYLITRLGNDGIPVIDFNQTVKNMSGPMKGFESLVLDGALWHDNNACNNWMMSNVTARTDAKGNIYPRKENDNDDKCKIDGPVSTIMAIGLWEAENATDSGGLDDFLSNAVVA